MRASLLLAVALLVPVPAAASCAAGGVPSYQDITYVKVRLYSLVGILHPFFEYEGRIVPPRGSYKAFADGTLDARRAVPYVGKFVAVEPHQTFDAVVAVLAQNHFFEMRLTAPACCLIDGPEDAVTAIRCGVTTTLATATAGGTADLGDAQGKAFLRLEDALQKTVFAAKWIMPTPVPK